MYMDKAVINQLRANKYFPKIPTSDVFFHEPANLLTPEMRTAFQGAYDFIQKDEFEKLPNEPVDVTKIFPTQKFLSFTNLEKAKPKHETGAYLVKYNGDYYILDGHHRIANDILDGETHIIAYVYDIDKNDSKMNVRKIVREILSEIDWAGDFADVKQSCIDPKEVADYLNRVRANATKSYQDREKFKMDKPFVHAKSSFFQDTDEGVDIDHFIKKITEPPKNIINTNEKILKSGGPHEYVFKTGIPAFRGIVYDKDGGTFHYINTCPGAGSCAVICYAMKGRYIQYPASYDSMTRRLNFLLNHPDRYEEQMYSELVAKCEEYGAHQGYKPKIILRWNDSGDFFTKKYVQIAERVMDRLKNNGYNVEGYAYTKIANVATKSAIDTTFSSGANKIEREKIDLTKEKNAVVIPSSLTKGLNLLRLDDEAILKKRIVDAMGLNPGDVLTYDEMMATPKGDVPKWHVIVTPNDGDDAAFRKDVKTILLQQH